MAVSGTGVTGGGVAVGTPGKVGSTFDSVAVGSRGVGVFVSAEVGLARRGKVGSTERVRSLGGCTSPPGVKVGRRVTEAAKLGVIETVRGMGVDDGRWVVVGNDSRVVVAVKVGGRGGTVSNPL